MVGKVIAASISGISCRVLRGEQCYYVKLRMLTDIKSGYEMIAHVGNCILPSLFFVDAARDATRSWSASISVVVSSQFASCIAQVRKFAFCHCIAHSKPGLFCMQATTVPKKIFLPLVNKPDVNGVTLREQNLSKKHCQSSELKVCFKECLDLSKELLWVSLSHRVAKLQAIKVLGMKKKFYRSARVKLAWARYIWSRKNSSLWWSRISI